MKRILMFVAVNFAVMIMLSVVMHFIIALAGPEVNEALSRDGINYFTLAVFSLVFGMGGAFISLLASKPIAKWTTGAQVVDGTENDDTRWLVSTVERLARTANVKTPEVAIYRGEPNAFATGAFRNSALVAVSDQIMERMDRRELEAVLGHEMSHVVNGDMVTLTLVQGVLNAVVLFLSRIIAYAVENAMGDKDRRRGSSGIYLLTVIVMQMLLGIAASVLVCAYSRRREFAADAGSARLLGSPQPMIDALHRLASCHGELPKSLSAFGIGGKAQRANIFSTHPTLEARVEALQNLRTGV